MQVRRAHPFLTTCSPEDIEVGADRFFRSLGYRRDAGGSLLYKRGRPWGGVLSFLLRDCPTRVFIEHRQTETSAVVTVRHEVDTLGRWAGWADVKVLDQEARLFEAYIEQTLRPLDTEAFVQARERAATNALTTSVVAFLAGFGLVLGFAAWLWLRLW